MSSMAHVFLKKGMLAQATDAANISGIIGHAWTAATNIWILGGMSLHVGALVVWLWALSRVDITFAYPFIALGYVLVSLMAWMWLGEQLNHTRLFGMATIVVGIVILSRSA